MEFSILNFFAKPLWERFIKSLGGIKVLVVSTTVALVCLYVLEHNFFIEVKIVLYNILKIIFKYWYYDAIILIPIIGFTLLVKKSHRLFIDEAEKYFRNSEIFKISNRNCVVRTEIVDNYKNGTREVSLYNETNNMLQNISGQIILYTGEKIIQRIDLDLTELQNGERVYYEQFDPKLNVRFNRFQTKLNQITIENKKEENIVINSARILKTYSFLLKKSNFLFGMEVSWLKEKFIQNVYHKLKGYYYFPSSYIALGNFSYYKPRFWHFFKVTKRQRKIILERKINQCKLLIIYSFFVGYLYLFTSGTYMICSEIKIEMNSLFKFSRQ